MQFIVNESNPEKRRAFYRYIIKRYNIKDLIKNDNLIYSNFPFIIDFGKNTFWICNSITCCACAAQNDRIIGINAFKDLTKKM